MYDQRYDALIQNNCPSCDTIPSILVIDSKYRDSPASDTQTDYRVTLTKKYPDVVSIELVYAGIPNSNYNVTADNNQLHIMPIGEMTYIGSWSGGVDATLEGTTNYSFDSLSGGVRPSTAGTNDNTIAVTRNASGIITSITVVAGGVNWIPGEQVTLATTDTTPVLAQALTFTVTETAVSTFTISPGLYTNTTLVNALDAQLATIAVTDVVGEDLSGDIVTNAEIGYPLDTYVMTSTGSPFPFAVKVVRTGTSEYLSRSITRLLGFKPENVYSTLVGADYKLVSHYPVMLEMDHYISMFIEGMERCDGNHSHIHGAFCVVPLNAQQDNFGMFKDSNNINNDKYKYYFVQPRKLAELHISFKDWLGNPYSFNGQDHLLIFRIETLTHRKKFSIIKQ